MGSDGYFCTVNAFSMTFSKGNQVKARSVFSVTFGKSFEFSMTLLNPMHFLTFCKGNQVKAKSAFSMTFSKTLEFSVTC